MMSTERRKWKNYLPLSHSLSILELWTIDKAMWEWSSSRAREHTDIHTHAKRAGESNRKKRKYYSPEGCLVLSIFDSHFETLDKIIGKQNHYSRHSIDKLQLLCSFAVFLSSVPSIYNFIRMQLHRQSYWLDIE